jgi:hypothetical protein
MEPFELPHFAVGTPDGVAGTRVAQVGVAVGLETTVEIEAARQLVGECLVLNEAVLACRPDSPLVG